MFTPLRPKGSLLEPKGPALFCDPLGPMGSDQVKLLLRAGKPSMSNEDIEKIFTKVDKKLNCISSSSGFETVGNS